MAGRKAAESKESKSGPLTPTPLEEQAKTGEAFTPEQMDQIEAGEYPTPRQLTAEEKDAAEPPKPELQKEQEERIESGAQGDRE